MLSWIRKSNKKLLHFWVFKVWKKCESFMSEFLILFGHSNNNLEKIVLTWWKGVMCYEYTDSQKELIKKYYQQKKSYFVNSTIKKYQIKTKDMHKKYNTIVVVRCWKLWKTNKWKIQSWPFKLCNTVIVFMEMCSKSN